MPYRYRTFSDLYEEEQRLSAPSSPVAPSDILPSPVFLLPTSKLHHRSEHRPRGPTRSPTQTSLSSEASCSTSSSRSRKLATSLRRTLASSLAGAWTKRSSSPAASSASSCRSSIRPDSLFLSSASSQPSSSANTSPAISRVNTRLSDYDALIERTRKAEDAEERRRQDQIQAFYAEAEGTELSLRRF